MSSGATRANRALWHIFDAREQTMGRLAAHVSRLVMGKHKPTYSPHLDHGDNVVVVNASDLVLTGKKRTEKLYRWHTGFPGGLKSQTTKLLMDVKKRPEEVIQRAVNGMLPKNKLRKVRMERLHVFATEEHPLWDNFSAEQREAFEQRQRVYPKVWGGRKKNRLPQIQGVTQYMYESVTPIAEQQEAAIMSLLPEELRNVDFDSLTQEEQMAHMKRVMAVLNEAGPPPGLS